MFHSQTEDIVKDDNDDKEIYTQKTIPQLDDTENDHQISDLNNTSSDKSEVNPGYCKESSHINLQLNSLDNSNHIGNSPNSGITSEQQKENSNEISYSPEATSSPPANMISLSPTSHSPSSHSLKESSASQSAQLISTSNKPQITSPSTDITSSSPNPDTIQEVNPSDSTEKISLSPKPESSKSESPKEPISSQSSQRSTADVVKSAMDTLHSESRVLVETYHDHCSVELEVNNCCGSGSQRNNECVGSELDGDVENGLQSKVDDVEECVIENLLTPLEESLSLPSSSECLVLVDETGKKKGTKKHKGKSKTKSLQNFEHNLTHFCH